MPGDAWRCRKSPNAASLRLGKAKAWIFGCSDFRMLGFLDFRILAFGPRPKA